MRDGSKLRGFAFRVTPERLLCKTVELACLRVCFDLPVPNVDIELGVPAAKPGQLLAKNRKRGWIYLADLAGDGK